MNIEKADIFTIAQLGNNELLDEKLKLIKKTLPKVKDEQDKNNNTLLHKAIIGRNFDIAKELLNLKCKINCISNEGYNELHYIAYCLGSDESFEVAKKIIEKGGNLNLKDKKIGNSPFNYFCQMGVRTINNNPKFKDFLLFCMKYKPELYEKNNHGKTIFEIVTNFGNPELIEIINLNK